jgi:hypothetical protein
MGLFGIGGKKKPATTPATAAKAVPANSVIGGRTSPISPSNPIFQESGNDERGRVQNRIVDESSRFRGQMDPYINTLGEGFGRAMENGSGDYDSIMKGFGSVPQVNARYSSYSDPFKSYGDFEGMSKTGGYDIPTNDAYQGYKGFSQDGGYSASDIADLRSRGVSPIRAAYGNAEREVSRGRALQGGYSPNAAAVQAKMAREQGQGMADAMQNVNAGIIDSRNRNKLSGMEGMAGIDTNRIGNQIKGMQGMSDIENSRLGAEMQTNQFNATAGMQADQWNAGNRLNALQGASSLYGTTPGMANMFGDQLGRAIAQSGQQGSSYIGNEANAQQLDGRYENTKGYINDIATYANPAIDGIQGWLRNRRTSPVNPNSPGPWAGGMRTGDDSIPSYLRP